MTIIQPWRLPIGYTTADFLDYHGFCYIITAHPTGRRYLGKKSFTRGSPWQNYFGSSDELTSDIAIYGQGQFVREIVSLHLNAGDLTYAEARLQFHYNVLHAVMDDGVTPAWYNRQILGKIHKRSIRNPILAMKLMRDAASGPLDFA